MQRIINVSVLLLLIAQIGFAQSKDVLAKAAFRKAQNEFGSGEYPEAINKLDEVVEMLGGATNPRIEYLRSWCYYEMGETNKAQKSLETYFELASDSDPNYGSMLDMIENIKEKGEILKREKAALEIENTAWETAKLSNTVSSYESFIANYANSKFKQEAKKRLSSIPTPPLVDPRDDQEYQTTRIGSQLWMAENLRYDMKGTFTERKKFNRPEFGLYYSRSASYNACPSGWHLPAKQEVQQLINYLNAGSPTTSSDNNYYHEFYYSYTMNSSLRSTTGWRIPGSNSTGFGAVPSATVPSLIIDRGSTAAYWMTEGRWKIVENTSFDLRTSKKTGASMGYNYPCRCIKDEG